MPKTEEKQTITAVIYARYSSDRQREESIEGQIRECKAFAAANGYRIIGTYIDRAMSARTDQRPDFQRMIHDSDRHLFQFVIVYALDRFSRSRYDSAIYKNRLKKNGVRVLSAKENIRDDPTGVILESLLEGYAEYYSLELAQKVRRGMADNLLEKKWVGTVIPFGYKKGCDSRLYIDEQKRQAVIDIFQMYSDRSRLVDIISYLNAHHFTTAQGRPFSRNSLNNILVNSIYTGTFRWAGTVYPGYTPRIISDELFNKVQKIKEGRKRNMIKNTSPDYELTGKIFCGRCGRPMVGVSGTGKSGNTYFYYKCSGKTHGRKDCDAKAIRRDAVESAVYNATVAMLKQPHAIKIITAQAILAQEREQGNSEVDRLKHEKAALDAKIRNISKAVAAGLTADEIIAQANEYSNRSKELESLIRIEELKEKAFTLTPEAVTFFLEKLLEKAETGNATLSTFWDFIRCIKINGCIAEIHFNYTAVPATLDNPIRIKIETHEECSNDDVLVDHQGFEPRTP